MARAKDRSDQFGHRSVQISEISREARSQADALEKKAKENFALAQEANDTATAAYDMARVAYDSLQNVSNDLETSVHAEIGFTKHSVEQAKKKVADAQERADNVYDDSLDLFTTVNSLTPPEVNIDGIKRQTAKNNAEADKIEETMNEMRTSNENLLVELSENMDQAVNLIQG